MSVDRMRLGVTVAVCFVLAACGAVPANHAAPPSPRASSATSAADATRCADLASRSVIPCPPPILPSEGIDIRNGTGGAVPDADVRTLGVAYLRVHALYTWAVRQDIGDMFLLSGAIVPADIARTNIFSTEIRVFSTAHAAGGTVRIQPLTTTEITLVPVPAALRTLAARDGLQPSPYAWVDNQSGPARVTVLTPDGGSHDVLQIARGEPHPILVFGQVREDADLGSIWYLGGEYGCLASLQVRAVCGM